MGCAYCSGGFEEEVAMKVIDIDYGTRKLLFMCPECGYQVWEK